MKPNKEHFILNLPSFIVRVDVIGNSIVLREIPRWNNGIDDETLQLVLFDNWFYMLTSV